MMNMQKHCIHQEDGAATVTPPELAETLDSTFGLNYHDWGLGTFLQ